MILRPMLASPSTAASNRAPVDFAALMATGEWVADVKLDGIRAFGTWDGVRFTLTNRNDVDITAKFPELVTQAEAHFPRELPGPCVLDGEIVALDGRFETVLTRDKTVDTRAIARLSGSHPTRFVAFDLPTTSAAPWIERRAVLDGLHLDTTPGFGVTPYSHDADFLDRTRELGLEGVIAKRMSSRYESGTRSRSWVKFKTAQRISCLAAGYAPGNGARAHFGAMTLALVDESGDVVLCGRVGSGFTVKDTHELKARLDQGDILVVEIEALNRTSTGQLRFPVFKGVRTDLAPRDCTTAQLEQLPRC